MTVSSSQASSQAQAFSVTHRSVLAIAVPMTLAYLSTPLLGIVDTAVIGQLGDPALLGGIAVGGVIFDVLFMSFSFLRSGTTGLTAQATGADDQIEIKATALRALIVACLIGLAILLVQSLALGVGLRLIGGSAEVQDATERYFSTRIYSAPFLLANYAILGWFLGLGRAGTGLLLQLVSNGLNIVLSLIFVLWLDWSVEGVAAGTVISEAVTALLGASLFLRSARHTPWPARETIFDKRLILRMMAVNRDIMIRSFCLLSAFGFFTSKSAAQGDVLLAANALLDKLFLVASYFLDGLATAAEQFAGRAVGARNRKAFDLALKITSLWSYVLAGLLAAIFLSAGPALLDLMTTDAAVRETGKAYLIWSALTPLSGVLAFLMDGVFIGATWSRDMRNMMLLSLAVFIAAFYILFPMLGNHGLWLALNIFFGMRGFSLWLICRKRRADLFPEPGSSLLPV